MPALARAVAAVATLSFRLAAANAPLSGAARMLRRVGVVLTFAVPLGTFLPAAAHAQWIEVTVTPWGGSGYEENEQLQITVEFCGQDGAWFDGPASIHWNGQHAGLGSSTEENPNCSEYQVHTGTVTMQEGTNTLYGTIAGNTWTEFTEYYEADPAAPPPPASVSVTPDGAQKTVAPNTNLDYPFTVKNTGQVSGTFKLIVQCTPYLTDCPDSIPSVTLSAGSSQIVRVPYRSAVGGSGTMKLRATNAVASAERDSGTVAITSTAGGHIAPLVSTLLHNGSNRNTAQCELACFDASIRYSTPPYVSLDVARSLTLVYNSATADPRATLSLDVRDSTAQATRVSLRLRNALGEWVTFTTNTQEIFFEADTGWMRIGAQFSTAALTTGAHWYTAVVTSYWADNQTNSTDHAVRILVLNERGSPYGNGWSLLGVQRLYPQGDSVTVTDGTGSAAYFRFAYTRLDGNARYSSPEGDFTEMTRLSAVAPDGALYIRYNPYDGSTLRFSASGMLIEMRDRLGNSTRYSYDATSRLIQVVDPTGRAIELRYRTAGTAWMAGTLDSIVTPGGRVTRVFVDADGDTREIWDPDGHPASLLTYDAAHRLIRLVDRRGVEKRLGYDHAGKLAADSSAVFLAGTRPVRLVSRLRSVEKVLLPVPGSGSGSFANPAAPKRLEDLRAEVVDPRGLRSLYTLDRYGAALQIDTDTGRAVEFVRDEHSRVTRVVTGEADTVDYTWVNPNNLTRVYDRRTGRDIRFSYEGWSLFYQLKQVAGNADSLWYYYSSTGTLDSTRSGSDTAAVTAYEYDPRGRVVRTIDALGNLTEYFRGASGWMNTDSVRVSGRLTRNRFDAFGRTTATVAPDGTIDSVIFDALNRVSALRGPDGYEVQYTYSNSVSVPDSVIDPVGQAVLTYTNELGLVERLVDAAGAEESFVFDTAGNAVEWRNRRGQVTSFAYDRRGRVQQRRLSDGRISTYVYESVLNGVYGINEEGSSHLSLTARGGESNSFIRPDWQDWWSVLSSPEVSTNAMEISLGRGSLVGIRTSRVERDARALPTRAGPVPHPVTLRHNALQQLTFMDASGRRQWLEYRPSNALALSEHNYPNSSIGAGFVHDKLGRVIEERNISGDSLIAFDYDDLGRLVATRHYVVAPGTCDPIDPTNPSQQRCSDHAGSLIASTGYQYDLAGNPVSSVTPAPGNRIITYGDIALEYDADGNVARKSQPGFEQRFYWNSVNQLDSVYSVATSGTSVVRFGYDAFGRRVRKSTATDTTIYLHFGEQLMAELDAAGNLRRSYTYLPGGQVPLTMEQGGYYYNLLSNAHGTVARITTAQGAAVGDYVYSPWGEVLHESGSISSPFRYAGMYYDSETKLYATRTRYYDPEIGRFISEDPLGMAGGVNVYAYAGNDPLNFGDPSGLCVRSGDYHAPHDDHTNSHWHYYTLDYLLRKCRAEMAADQFWAWMPRGLGLTGALASLFGYAAEGAEFIFNPQDTPFVPNDGPHPAARVHYLGKIPEGYTTLVPGVPAKVMAGGANVYLTTSMRGNAIFYIQGNVQVQLSRWLSIVVNRVGINTTSRDFEAFGYVRAPLGPSVHAYSHDYRSVIIADVRFLGRRAIYPQRQAPPQGVPNP